MVSRFKQRVDFVWLVVPFFNEYSHFLCAMRFSLSLSLYVYISRSLFCAHTLDITLHPSIVLVVVNALPFCDTVTYVCFSDESIGKCIRSHIHRNCRKQQKGGICKRLQMRTYVYGCVFGICPHACVSVCT